MQTRGNCATRSIREALKDMLPDHPDLFNKLYHFVSNEKVIDSSIIDFNSKHTRPIGVDRDYTIQNQILNNTSINPSNLELCKAQYDFKRGSKHADGTLLHYAIFKNKSALIADLMGLGMTGEEINRSGDSALLYHFPLLNTQLIIAN